MPRAFDSHVDAAIRSSKYFGGDGECVQGANVDLANRDARAVEVVSESPSEDGCLVQPEHFNEMVISVDRLLGNVGRQFVWR